MKAPLCSAFLVLTAAMSLADVVLEQKLESPMLSGTVSMKVKGDQVRMDMPSPAGGTQTLLINGKAQELTTMIHDQKVAMKVNLNFLKKSAQDAQKAAGVDLKNIEKPKATGKTEKLGEWNTEIYEYTFQGAQSRLWVAKDYPNYKAINKQLATISGQMSDAMGVDPTSFDLPGLVVKSEITTPGGKMVSTVVQAKEESVPESEFTVPQGYQEMKMPEAQKAE